VSYNEKETPGMSTNDSPDTGEPIDPLPQVIAGVIGAPTTTDVDAGTKSGDLDFYCFTAAAGEILTVHAQPSAGSPVNPAVIVVSKDDASYLRVGHPDSNHVSERQAYLPTAGGYCVGIADDSFFGNTPVGGNDYAYTVSVSKAPFAATDPATT